MGKSDLSLIAVAGPPAAGKTTLMRLVIPELGRSGGMVKWAQVTGELYPETRALVLGTYDTEDAWAGTDKLGMHVSPQAVRLLQTLSRDPQWNGWTVLAEGDRLVNDKLLAATLAAGIRLRVVALNVPPDVLAARHAVRGDHQDDRWVKGRATKAERLAAEYNALRLPHRDAAELTRAVQVILSLVNPAPAVPAARTNPT